MSPCSAAKIPAPGACATQVHGTAGFSFGLQRPAAGQTGTFLDDDQLCLQTTAARVESAAAASSMIQLRGEHNLLNVLAACAIAARRRASRRRPCAPG